MKRQTRKINVGNTQTRYINTLSSDPIDPGDPQLEALKRYRCQEMFRLVADQPELRFCGPADFQTLSVTWNGASWVFEFKALIDNN